MKVFEELTQYQIELISNGCGAKASCLKPPHSIFFKASCDKHDIGYFQGGSEEDRLECDIKFLQAMLNDCSKVKNRISRYRYILWSYLYFAAVRTYGFQYFTYRHQRLTLEQVIYYFEKENSCY